MIFIIEELKNNPTKRWDLPEEIFFAAGACHILAYAFLEKYHEKGFKAFWIKPGVGHRGNHVFVTNGNISFDYLGFSPYQSFLENTEFEMKSTFYEWNYELIELPKHVLISSSESKKFEGLQLREPGQFLHNALPRAEKYLKNFDWPL